MPRGIATVAYALGILWLFVLDRDRKSQVSVALWIPVAWVCLAGSRMVSQWLQVAPLLEGPEQYLEGSPLDRFVLTGLLAAGLLVLLARARRAGALLRANGPILLFLLYCAASVLWSDYPTVAFKRWTKGFGNLVMVLVVLSEPDPLGAVKRLLGWSGFLLIPLSVLLVKYYPELGRGYNPWTWRAYYTGVATGKNGLGYVCLIFGLGSLWRLLDAWQGMERPRRIGPLIAHGAVLAMAVWLFQKADSATSLVCFLLGSGLLAFTSLRGFARRPAAVHSLVGVVVFLFLFALAFPDVGTGFVTAMERDTTLTGRTELWKDLLQVTVDPWFGTGFESFWLGERAERLWNEHPWHPNQAHNGYLEVLLNLGWTGVALLGLVMAWGYRNVARAFRRDPRTGRLRLAYFVAAAIYNLTEAAFKGIHPVWIVFLLAVTAIPEPLRPEDD